MSGFDIEGNVAFNTGTINNYPFPEILVTDPASSMVVSNNFVYRRMARCNSSAKSFRQGRRTMSVTS